MATACLREDRWLVHHLAADLPVSEVTDLVKETAASLVVLSAATSEAVQRAAEEVDEITRSAPPARLRVLAGRPGDSLGQLRQLARTSLARPADG
jgi:methanogenic corrinoid protein MtbC1